MVGPVRYLNGDNMRFDCQVQFGLTLAVPIQFQNKTYILQTTICTPVRVLF